MAIAAVHERLYAGDHLNTVPLDAFLSDLCRDLGHALGCENIELELAPATMPIDMAVPLALLVNELIANAIQHGGGRCRIALRNGPGDMLRLAVVDAGRGPAPDQQPRMGLRIMRGLARQLGATIETKVETDSYMVVAIIPLPRSHGT